MFMPSPNVSLVAAVHPSPPVEHDPVPAEVKAVIALFNAHLAKVAFPDVDAAALCRHAADLRTEAQNVAKARDALAAAVAVSDARLLALTDATARAIAYAQIYSEGHPDRAPIASAIAELAQAAPAPAPIKTGKRRGRPPKHSAELFDASTQAPDGVRA